MKKLTNIEISNMFLPIGTGKEDIKQEIDSLIVMSRLSGYTVTGDNIFGDCFLTFMDSKKDYITLSWNLNNTIDREVDIYVGNNEEEEFRDSVFSSEDFEKILEKLKALLLKEEEVH